MRTRGPNPIGYHVSAAGGIGEAVNRAVSIGCDAFQTFPSNPRGWALPDPSPEMDTAAANQIAAAGMRAAFLHAPYLVNLASDKLDVRERSYETLSFALDRAERIGATGVVFHAGSAGEASRSEGLNHTARAVSRLARNQKGPLLIVELTAGGGNPIASLPGHTRDYLDAVGGNPRVAFCIDTQHLFAAGFPWHSRGGLDRLCEELSAGATIDRVVCIHINDSKSVFDSRHDRHEVIGKGKIGSSPIRRFAGHMAFRGISLILETPGPLEAHEAEIRFLRRAVHSRDRGSTRQGIL